jgi:hypothetical protein
MKYQTDDLRIIGVHELTPPPIEWRELRGWVDRLQALKEMHQQESNRMEAHRASGQMHLVQDVQTHLDWLQRL